MVRQVVRAGAYGLGLTGLWLILAFVNDGTAYHLAPILVGAVVPAGVALSGREVGTGSLAIGAALGAVLATAGTVILAATDNLEGASLLPFGSATTEAVIFSFAGAAGGFLLAALGRGGGDA
jgi:hypothetical protein